MGEPGQRATAEEVRIEMAVPASKRRSVLSAVVGVHPYEQPAYFVFPAVAAPVGTGLGRIGRLPEAMTLPVSSRSCTGRCPPRPVASESPETHRGRCVRWLSAAVPVIHCWMPRRRQEPMRSSPLIFGITVLRRPSVRTDRRLWTSVTGQ